MIELENELSEKLREGFARVFTVVLTDPETNEIKSVKNYPTLEMVEKNTKSWLKFFEENNIEKENRWVQKVYAGSVYYAGEKDHNRLVKY